MMRQEIQVIDPCTSEEWMQFICSHPEAGIFHHPAWLKILRDTYGYRVFAACLREGDKIVAGIPFADVQSFVTGNRWVSLPFSDNCAPLLPKNNPAAIEKLIAFLKNGIGTVTAKVEIHWDIKGCQTHRESNFVCHSRSLDPQKSKEELFKSFEKRTTQRSIRIAEKEGVVVKACISPEEFDLFYQMQVKTRKRLGVPVQSRSFFESVWKEVLVAGLGFALIAFKDKTPLGGGVFLTFNKKMVFKYSASDSEYRALQPTYAFVWAAMQRGLAEGCTTFDFGRSDKENEGLRRFKMNWGAEEQELAYTIIGARSRARASSRLDDIVGVVIRNSPKFVCKLSGMLLYRHFA